MIMNKTWLTWLFLNIYICFPVSLKVTEEGVVSHPSEIPLEIETL